MRFALSRPSPGRWLLAVALLAAAAGATARNERLLLPIDAALRGPAARSLVATDIALRFGTGSAAAGDTNYISTHAVADPFTSPSSNGTRVRRADEVVCQDAFRKAVMDLQHKARSQGGTTVLGIVSNYNNVVMSSREVYECHIGHSRGVVDLLGVVSKGASPVTAPPLARAAPPAPQAPAAPAAPQPPRIASGFAAIDDIDAIPYLSDRGRQHYREWLAFPTPKAFAISGTGHFFSTSGLKPKDSTLPTDPVERAVVGCERNSKTTCKLYAVNGSVVWVK